MPKPLRHIHIHIHTHTLKTIPTNNTPTPTPIPIPIQAPHLGCMCPQTPHPTLHTVLHVRHIQVDHHICLVCKPYTYTASVSVCAYMYVYVSDTHEVLYVSSFHPALLFLTVYIQIATSMQRYRYVCMRMCPVVLRIVQLRMMNRMYTLVEYVR